MSDYKTKAKVAYLKVYNSFNYSLSIKKIGIVVITAFLFFAFNDRITLFIENFLFVKEDFSNYWLDLLIISTSVFSVIYIIKRYIKYKYLSSYTEVYFSFIFSISILFFFKEAKELSWTFYKDQILSISYVWYLIIPLFFVIILFCFKLFSRHFIIPFNNLNNNNEFKNDDPIFKINDDKLGYSPIVKRLSDILIKEKHEKSLSIGLVGPWGNGKSSVINMLKDKIENKQFLKQSNITEVPIVVHFLPYLNHKEDDIINEFFIALSDKLSSYNGKLSNQIISYSQKLTDLYKDQNILGLVDNHISRISDTPAKELYDDINSRLKEIDKKIIVFVDDLDRLNDKEILQVLKLIRNTADFYNTIFVVAMDKQYVLGRLTNNNSILNSNFVDKFFQLEVYLPEIDQVILKKYVQDILLEALSGIKPTFQSELASALSNEHNLFNDYIKNFRDAKRIINQIIYDYRNFGTEIDLKDFMNFTYFKLKFPKFMKLLNDNRLDYLESDSESGIYKLIETEKNTNNNEDLFTILRRERNKNDYSYLDKYEIKNKLKLDDKYFENILNVDSEDRILLVKTLAHLFGNENKDNRFNSIRKINNFRMLMQQRVFADLFKEQEFVDLIKDEDIVRINTDLTNLFNENKIDQVINRLQYFNSAEETEIDRVIIILLQLFSKRNLYNLTETATLDLLGKLMLVKQKINSQIPDNLSKWIKANIFESDTITTVDKINLLDELWEARNENSNWNLESDYITATAKILYDKYLEEVKIPWDVGNFSFYGIYHDLKLIEGVKPYLIEKFRAFWARHNIELLCAQTLSFSSFSVTSFNISDLENEIFGSKVAFFQFVKEHKNNNTPGVIEFLEFLELCRVTHFKQYLKFNFQKSNLVLQRIENQTKQYGGKVGRDHARGIKQVIFETNDLALFNSLRGNNGLFKMHDFSVFENNKVYHILVSFNIIEFKSEISAFTKQMYLIALKTSDWDKAIFLEKKILVKENFVSHRNNEKYIKVISIQ